MFINTNSLIMPTSTHNICISIGELLQLFTLIELFDHRQQILST